MDGPGRRDRPKGAGNRRRAARSRHPCAGKLRISGRTGLSRILRVSRSLRSLRTPALFGHPELSGRSACSAARRFRHSLARSPKIYGFWVETYGPYSRDYTSPLLDHYSFFHGLFSLSAASGRCQPIKTNIPSKNFLKSSFFRHMFRFSEKTIEPAWLFGIKFAHAGSENAGGSSTCTF
jgi:hypothetical protein